MLPISHTTPTLRLVWVVSPQMSAHFQLVNACGCRGSSLMTSIRSPICPANRAGDGSGNDQYGGPETASAVPSNTGDAAAVRNELSPRLCTGAIQAITQDEIILVSTCDLRTECHGGREMRWPATCGRCGRRRNSGSVSHVNNNNNNNSRNM